MSRKLLYIVAGARPNFMKIAPVIRALDKQLGHFEYKIIHTGQHYDQQMSKVFFEELSIPQPDYYLECAGGSHAEQTAKIMVAFEQICRLSVPDGVIVVGDVNSTLACTIVAKKLNISVAHIEAGLRSGDLSMPEEINRLVTDSISDWFFCTEPAAVEYLSREGKLANQIFYVGNVMVDNLFYQRDVLRTIDKANYSSEKIKQKHPRYAVLTLHRPSNVDEKTNLQRIMRGMETLAERIPIVFPVHPRTRNNLDNFGIKVGQNIILVPPMSYMDFLNLWNDAVMVLTDSGGLQEETTALGVACLTLRQNTERPITLQEGTNILVGNDPVRIVAEAERILTGHTKQGRRPALWDGHAAERIVGQLKKIY